MIYAFAILCAIIEALYDFSRIKRHLPINHRIGWVRRFVVLTWWAGIFWVFTIESGQLPPFQWLELIGAAFLFSSVFRLVLNYKRGLDLRYVSPNAWYDWQFLCLTWYNSLSVQLDRRFAVSYHLKYYKPTGVNDQYQRAVHRAGLLAYLVEISVSAICILL